MKQKIKFKQTEIGLIPEDWEVVILGLEIDIIGGGTPKTSVKEFWAGKIPWISVVDFVGSKRWIYDTEKHITQKGLEKSSTKLLHKNQLIISARGTVGELGQVTRDMAFNQSCYGIDGKGSFDNNFLYHLLKHKVNEFIGKGHGAVFNTITRNTFNQILVAKPEINEQKSIAKTLSDLDSKIELLQKQNETLEKIGQAIFKQWFVDFEFPNEENKPYKSSGGEMVESELGEIPKGWSVGRLGEKIKTVLGGTPSKSKPEYWDGEVPWINSGAINDFPVMNFSETISELGLKNSAAKLMPKGTVVLPFVISVGKEVKISILGIESSGNQSVLGVLENEDFSSEFIYNWIQLRKGNLYLSATGGAQQHINKGNVDSMELLIPRKDILNDFNIATKNLFSKIYLNSKEILSLQKTRDLLIPKLMTGKIRVPLGVRE